MTMIVRLRTLPLCLLAFALLFGSACTDQPRNGSTPASRNQTYSGYAQFPNLRVSVQIKKLRGSNAGWTEFSWATTSPSPAFTDNCNVPWYPWTAHVTLPSYPGDYWDVVPIGLPTTYLQTRAVASGTGTVLASYDQDADKCIQQYACGQDVITHCSKPDGVIKLVCPGHPCW